jgi:hypothetical protein
MGRTSLSAYRDVYSPTDKKTGVAVIVFPCGGYEGLAIDLEGTEVCDWLTAKGITCALLKYRVPGNGLEPRSEPYPKSPMALEDAQRTVGLVRFHAAGCISIHARLECSGFQRAAIWWQRPARILNDVYTGPSMRPTQKAADRILRWFSIGASIGAYAECVHNI